MKLLAVDPSLQSSGFAYQADDEIYVGTIEPKKLRGPERLAYMRDEVSSLLYFTEATVISYEDYSMGSKGKVFHIGELGGVLKLLAYERGVDVLLVPPTVLKQYITGRGNASKEDMQVAVRTKYGCKVTQADEVDAYSLFQFGAALLTGNAKDFESKCDYLNSKK